MRNLRIRSRARRTDRADRTNRTGHRAPQGPSPQHRNSYDMCTLQPVDRAAAAPRVAVGPYSYSSVYSAASVRWLHVAYNRRRGAMRGAQLTHSTNKFSSAHVCPGSVMICAPRARLRLACVRRRLQRCTANTYRYRCRCRCRCQAGRWSGVSRPGIASQGLHSNLVACQLHHSPGPQTLSPMNRWSGWDSCIALGPGSICAGGPRSRTLPETGALRPLRTLAAHPSLLAPSPSALVGQCRRHLSG